MNTRNQFLFSVILIAISVALAFVVGEVLIRVKNSDGKNYHMEMWKYSQELKYPSDNTTLGHEHIPDSSAVLQNVELNINSNGMRGDDSWQNGEYDRRIMFLGSSATLGWGIPEAETMSVIVEEKLRQQGENVVVFNAGIGNYNAERYVELFLTKNHQLNPTDVVVNYYINDAEILDAGGGNILLRNSQLAVTAWILYNRFMAGFEETTLLDHYQRIYEPDYPGLSRMQTSLARLAEYCQQRGIRLYLMMMPEVHDLTDYQYHFAHEIMRDLASEYGYTFVDALEPMQQVEDTHSLWAMPGDPHPNGKAHRIFAETLLPFLSK